MYVFVEGIRIALNKSQIEIIEKARRKRERGLKSFTKTLVCFGFIELKDDIPRKDVRCFENKKHGWYAEIIIHNENWQEVWMVGGGLRQGSFPGGWMYETPKEIETEILKVLEILNA